MLNYITKGKVYNKGKIAFVKCENNSDLTDIRIKDECYLLIILIKGKLELRIAEKNVYASAPSFLCFDELENPTLISNKDSEYICIYFHPRFLNVNMSFDMLHSRNYTDIATTHDMFMLKPFLNREYVIPISDSQLERVVYCANNMQEELEHQRDWYWSCRGRSYFMEIIIILERMYGLIGYGFEPEKEAQASSITNPIIRDVVLHIETYYSNTLSLADISKSVGVSHSTITALMKKELGCTVMEFLMNHRILIAKKQLAFTEIPIKDIAVRSGFKTVQHFTRVFKANMQMTPAAFRKYAVDKRKNEIRSAKL